MDLSSTVIDTDGSSQPVSLLLVGGRATIIFICPYAFDDQSANNMEKLIISKFLFLSITI
jgi:hypothetical protein